MIIGRQPLIEALSGGRAIDKIYLQKGAGGDIIQKVRDLASERHIPIQLVPIEKLNGLTRSNHQGCIAIAAIISYIDLQQMIDLVVASGRAPLLLILDGITDVRNIGAIARTAVCCGAQGIIIPDKGVGALNEEAMKTSAGALEKIYVSRVTSLAHAVDTLHLNGIKVFSSEMKASSKLFDIDFTIPSCIVMGSEEHGVQSFLRKSSDEIFTIPMEGKFDSFNVSVATGIILYEAMKQRMMKA
ncbi:MAG: 23S rRNA (guanosine(2251)-2'-O)-methyltransferase RlmB [Bacteroidetes bacterium]|nr:MAG: 23S rRNA (guanosine(2251)-2'-O)-methyltransferase RlmB [Bacteroidota bacterium]